MRYTTIIDIEDYPTLYRNLNCRLVYLHMVLRAGYHDNDRDLVDISIRRLSMQVGISVSAVRNALQQLERAHLLTRQGKLFLVTKYVVQQAITSRPKTEKQKKKLEQQVNQEREKEERERQAEIERLKREQLRSQGKTNFMLYYESLKAKADAGDIEAQAAERRHRAAYAAQVQALQEELKQNNNG